jgi:hypothetical protein
MNLGGWRSQSPAAPFLAAAPPHYRCTPNGRRAIRFAFAISAGDRTFSNITGMSAGSSRLRFGRERFTLGYLHEAARSWLRPRAMARPSKTEPCGI